MPKPNQTAVVILVPAAKPMLSAMAAEYPEAVREGDPGHVSVLYPFLPVDGIDGAVDWLGTFAANCPPIVTEFTEVGREPGFVYLANPPELEPVVDAVRSRWPEVVPYGGRFGPSPAAHLTVAMGVTDEVAERIVVRVQEFLPLAARVEQLALVVFDGAGVPSIAKVFKLGG